MAIDMDVDEVDIDENSQNESDEEDRDETQVDENSENADDDDDDQENDEDEEDEDDDDEDDDEDDEEDGVDGEDEDDDEDEDADNEINSQKPRSPTPAVNTSPAAYVRACENRLKKIRNSSGSLGSNVPAYLIEPVGAAPHSAHIHAMALSADGTNLLTGGSDGHVRRYDVYASMNGKTPLTQNVRHQFVDGVVKGGALTAWWACEEVEQVKRGTEEEDDDQEVFVGPVHSLAIQQDSLWCLSGMESGNINLYSLRHDTGQIRHTLRRHTSAVSAMVLTKSDTELLSGGWDRSLHQWDLNTGQVVRSFPGHTGQVTSISIRPLQHGETWSNAPSPNIIIRPSAITTNSNDGEKSIMMDVKETESSPIHQEAQDGINASSQPIEVKDGDTSMREVDKSGGNSERKDDVKDTPNASKTDLNGSSPSKEDSSLFGGEDGMDAENGLHETLGLGTTGMDGSAKQENMMDVTMDESEGLKPTKPEEKQQNEKTMDDSDGDSLFGGMSADGSADADGEADVDADGEQDAEGEDVDAEGEDDDAEGEDDDAPLAARAAARPLQTPLMGSNGIELPGSQKIEMPGQMNGQASTTTTTTATPTRQRQMPKPAFGGASTFASFDGDVSKFSNDIMLTTTLGGQVTLWDKRVPSYPGSSTTYNNGQSVTSNGTSTHKGVRALALPDKTPPWCMSACWNSRGDKIYVGRRNETVDEWDLRMLPDVDQGMDEFSPARLKRGDAKFLKSIRLPTGSGPVSSILGMPNSKHIICGSYDNVRIWDTMAETNNSSNIPFRIVAGHHGATVSQILLDPTSKFLFTSSGDRGWMSTSTEAVILHEVRSATW